MATCALALAGAATAQAAGPGSLKTDFGHGGLASLPSDTRILGSAYQSDGKLVVVGQRGTKNGAALIVGRFTTSGALDGSFSGGLVTGPAVNSSFGTGSIGRAVAVQTDGKIVVVGKATDTSGTGTLGLLVERFNANGGVDAGFGAGGVVKALGAQFGDGYGVALQPDGKIVAVGTVNAVGGGSIVAVVRLSPSGGLDPSFASGGSAAINLGADSRALAVALQKDGKIVIAGSQAPGLQVPNALIARLTPAGALDPSFGGGGAFAHQYAIGAANSAFHAVAVQANGEIVAAGSATHGNTGADAIVVRFTAAGAPDHAFGNGVVYLPSAVNTIVTADTVPGANGLAFAANGDVIAGGTAANSTVSGVAAWALKANGALDASFGAAGGVFTGFGNAASGQGNTLAISPTGAVSVSGDAGVVGSLPAGLVVTYNGFSSGSTSLKASLGAVSATQKLSTVRKSGLKVTVACNVACSIAASLGISSGTAKQLGLTTSVKVCKKVKGKKKCTTSHRFLATTVASGKASLSGAGTKSITLKLSRAFTDALAKHKKVKKVSVTLQAKVSSGATHQSQTIKKGLTFTQ